MDVPPRDHDFSAPLLQLPSTLTPTEIMGVIQGADLEEEEIKLDNVCGSDASRLPDT